LKAFVAKSGWFRDESRRLDAAAYGEGGLIARDHIKAGAWPWCPLGELAAVYLPPRFVRQYVRDPSRGVPFLSSSDILLADLRGLPLLSRRAATNLNAFSGVPRSTLVSRSGTIGRTAYWREEMYGMAVSEDVIHVRPQGTRILPGYLFAFLTSAFAQAMIRQRTYGSVVQHIKPDHLDQIPVPFPDAAQQRHIHNLIERASVARTQAGQLLDEASGYFDELVGRLRHTHEHQLSLGVVRRSALRKTRLDAFTHTGWAADAVVVEGDPFSVLADVVSPNIRKRIFAERGTPFVSGVDIFQLRPTARARLRAGEAARTGALIGTGQLVVQRAGQRYGLLGRPAFVGRRLDGWACSQDLIRIVPRSSRTTGRIFAFLRSEAGRRQLVAQSSGTSIPAINSESLTDLVVPPLPAELVDKANEALKLREQADADEELAIWEVERWLA
jgi:type I restriction enzyme S subunit